MKRSKVYLKGRATPRVEVIETLDIPERLGDAEFMLSLGGFRLFLTRREARELVRDLQTLLKAKRRKD